MYAAVLPRQCIKKKYIIVIIVCSRTIHCSADNGVAQQRHGLHGFGLKTITIKFIENIFIFQFSTRPRKMERGPASDPPYICGHA